MPTYMQIGKLIRVKLKNWAKEENLSLRVEVELDNDNDDVVIKVWGLRRPVHYYFKMNRFDVLNNDWGIGYAVMAREDHRPGRSVYEEFRRIIEEYNYL